MSALNRIVVKGFKSIKEMDLELRNLNVLIGANGSGKSNLLSVFKLVNQLVQDEVQIRDFVLRSGGADALLYFGRKTTSELIVELEFQNSGYRVRLIPTASEELVIFSEEIRENNSEPWHQLAGFVRLAVPGSQLYLHVNPHNRDYEIASALLRDLKEWQVYHFNDTSDTAGVKLTSNVNDNARLRPDTSNLAAVLFLLQEHYPDYYRRIVQTIRLSAPFFRDFDLQPKPGASILLEWKQEGSDKYFNASHLSDGTLRFMCLATLLMQPEPPPLIIIDEPELGLHPYALELVASMIQSAATQRQIVVATQSAPFINYFSPEDIIVVDLEDNQSTFKRLTTDALKSWLEDYSLGEIWEKNIVGGTP